jgi:PAS domain-containing protein
VEFLYCRGDSVEYENDTSYGIPGADYLRKIIETTQDGFIVVDEHERIIDANKAFSALSGYTGKI